MNKEIWAGKKLVIKIVTSVVAVSLVGTGIGVGVVKAKNNMSKDTEVTTTKKEEEKDSNKDRDKDQEELLKKVIKTQVGSDDSKVGKEENVYVITDAYGTSKEVIVSDWLKNPQGKDTLKDASDLKDIKNVKGDETFTQGNDGALTWKAAGNDIYYQGTTKKAIPVDVKITYYLNGKEMKPEDMVGKSGKVTIRFDYDNKEKKTVQINNKDEEVYVPFTVMSAMVLPTDKFADITVKNGKVMSEGSNNIIMGLAFPGLQKSLNIDEEELKDKDIEIPDYVEVNAVTSDFSLDMTLSVVLSDALSDIHLTDSIDFSDIDKDMDKLTDASSELQDGTGKLKDGVNTLSEKTGEFQNGANKLSDGIKDYTNGVSTLAGGIDTLKSGAQSAADGASKLASGASQVSSGVNTLTDSLANMGSTLSDEATKQAGNQASCQTVVENDSIQVATDMQDYTIAVSAATIGAVADALQSGKDISSSDVQSAIISAAASETADSATKVSGDVNALAQHSGELGGTKGAIQVLGTINAQLDTSKLAELKSGAASVASGASDLSSGVNQINSGADQLKSGADTLTANSATLVDGANTLVDGTNKLADGVNELKTGANDLDEGMVKFDKEGISKLTDTFEGEGKNVVDRLKATMDASHDYHTFTKLPDGMDGSVKFIIRTEAVK